MLVAFVLLGIRLPGAGVLAVQQVSGIHRAFRAYVAFAVVASMLVVVRAQALCPILFFRCARLKDAAVLLLPVR